MAGDTLHYFDEVTLHSFSTPTVELPRFNVAQWSFYL